MAKRGRKAKKAAVRVKSAKRKRGRKPIFSDSQKRVLTRMIRIALAEQLRAVVKGLK